MKTDQGLTTIPDFITEAEEAKLLEIIKLYPGKDRPNKAAPSRMIRFGELNLTPDLKNDTMGKHHGYKRKRRSYSKMNDGYDVATEYIPIVLKQIAQRLVSIGVLSKLPPIYVINKYPPGYRISPHIDHFDNGESVPVVALCSDSKMIFTKKGVDSIEVDFPRRGLVSIEGPMRWDWFHQLDAVKKLRYSIVFRNLPK